MFLWLALRWWYGAGWHWAIHRAIIERLEWCAETFSILPLIKTWFSPFKQTFSGRVKGGLDVHFHAFLDNIVSRVIGFLIRSVLITVGLIGCVFVAITGILFILLWPLLPVLPFVAIVLISAGVGS